MKTTYQKGIICILINCLFLGNPVLPHYYCIETLKAFIGVHWNCKTNCILIYVTILQCFVREKAWNMLWGWFLYVSVHKHINLQAYCGINWVLVFNISYCIFITAWSEWLTVMPFPFTAYYHQSVSLTPFSSAVLNCPAATCSSVCSKNWHPLRLPEAICQSESKSVKWSHAKGPLFQQLGILADSQWIGRILQTHSSRSLHQQTNFLPSMIFFRYGRGMVINRLSSSIIFASFFPAGFSSPSAFLLKALSLIIALFFFAWLFATFLSTVISPVCLPAFYLISFLFRMLGGFC